MTNCMYIRFVRFIAYVRLKLIHNTVGLQRVFKEGSLVQNRGFNRFFCSILQLSYMLIALVVDYRNFEPAKLSVQKHKVYGERFRIDHHFIRFLQQYFLKSHSYKFFRGQYHLEVLSKVIVQPNLLVLNERCIMKINFYISTRYLMKLSVTFKKFVHVHFQHAFYFQIYFYQIIHFSDNLVKLCTHYLFL